MSLDPRLLAVLACPEDKGPLYYLGDDARDGWALQPAVAPPATRCARASP
jgi:uncharacterized protein YbaR (Trm112 family)